MYVQTAPSCFCHNTAVKKMDRWNQRKSFKMNLRFTPWLPLACSLLLLAAFSPSMASVVPPAPSIDSAAVTENSQGLATLVNSPKPGVADEAIESHRTVPRPAVVPTKIVPEPGTIIAGALLLVPFVASAWRILRRNRAA